MQPPPPPKKKKKKKKRKKGEKKGKKITYFYKLKLKGACYYAYSGQQMHNFRRRVSAEPLQLPKIAFTYKLNPKKGLKLCICGSPKYT